VAHPGHSFCRILVACRVGKVCPDWLTAITMVLRRLLVRRQKEKPAVEILPRALPSTPITLLLEMGTTRSWGRTAPHTAAI
jgi:hypothetical protein